MADSIAKIEKPITEQDWFDDLVELIKEAVGTFVIEPLIEIVVPGFSGFTEDFIAYAISKIVQYQPKMKII